MKRVNWHVPEVSWRQRVAHPMCIRHGMNSGLGSQYSIRWMVDWTRPMESAAVVVGLCQAARRGAGGLGSWTGAPRGPGPTAPGSAGRRPSRRGPPACHRPTTLGGLGGTARRWIVRRFPCSSPVSTRVRRDRTFSTPVGHVPPDTCASSPQGTKPNESVPIQLAHCLFPGMSFPMIQYKYRINSINRVAR